MDISEHILNAQEQGLRKQESTTDTTSQTHTNGKEKEKQKEKRNDIMKKFDERETEIFNMFATYVFGGVHKETTVAKLYLLFYITKNISI